MRKLLIPLLIFSMFTPANAGVCEIEFLKIKDVVASLYTKMLYKNPKPADFVAVKKQLNPKFTIKKQGTDILCIGDIEVKNLHYIIEFKIKSKDVEYTSTKTYPYQGGEKWTTTTK